MTHPTDGPQLDEEAVREILDTYFATGDLEAAIAEAGADDLSPARLFDYVSDSPEAQRYFDHLAIADRAFAEEEAVDEPGDFERQFGDAAFDAKLDAMLADERADGNEQTSHASDSSTVISLFGTGQNAASVLAAAALAALVAGTVLFEFGPRSSGDDDFQPRSAVTDDGRKTYASPEVELFCARPRNGGVDITGTDEIEDRLTCPTDAELKLGYRNRSPNLAYAAFFGVDESGTIYWYGPSPAAPSPVAVDQSEAIVPVGESIRLNVNHTPGVVRVHGLFSSEPIDHAALKKALARKSDRELWEKPRLRFEQWPSATTSTTFEVLEADRQEVP